MRRERATPSVVELVVKQIPGDLMNKISVGLTFGINEVENTK